MAKRMNSKLNELDYRPLVELYLQDLINDKNNKRGKFSKLMNYIENYKQFFHRQVDNGENTAIQELSQTVNECSRCSSTNSPIWWTVNSTKLCQSCYHSGGHDTNETKIRVQVGIRVSEGWGIYNVKWGKLWYQE